VSKWNPSNLRAVHTADISTLLSKDTEIRGTVKTQGSIRVDGAVFGDLHSVKTVTIGASGIVEGNVTGEDIIVAGKVKGTLTARGRISLEGSAQIEGDLNTTRLSIAEGAVFRGLSNMGIAVRPATRLEIKPEIPAKHETDRVAAA
jgi:cytoskeletal protein CcmA (bactofilin family)